MGGGIMAKCPAKNKPSTNIVEGLIISGGDEGIRTLDTPCEYTTFPM